METKMGTLVTWSVALACLLAIGIVACNDDGGGSGDTDTDTEDDSDSSGDAGTGDWCDENVDCETGYCETWQNVPQIDDSYCTEGLPKGQIRITGNVRDQESDEYQPSVKVSICGALGAMMDPSGAYEDPVATATTNADGIFEIEAGEEATSQSVGLVAMVREAGYYLTATGLVEPELGGGDYPPGIRNHDVKMISQSILDEWSDYLEAFDPSLSAYMPMGDNGGAISSLRHVETGEGVAGAEIITQLEASTARVYYLNEAGDGFNDQQTSSNGLFVIIEPALAEKFDAWRDGEIISRRFGTFGETFGAIYSNTMHVEGYAEQN